MKKTDLLIGVFIGIIASIIGSYVFIELLTEYNFIEGVKILRFQGKLGKIISLGSVLNIIVFFLLLKFNKELIARGVILGTILLAIITLLI
ncbi:MAG: hypothetical protein KA215_01145 [Flavobacterium sp.]|jgi:hypothetical protein|nr:hypothetical protein [Flavobacterium sp.]MBP6584255.1 hypothetical protein [Flavobacterium sp.]